MDLQKVMKVTDMESTRITKRVVLAIKLHDRCRSGPQKKTLSIRHGSCQTSKTRCALHLPSHAFIIRKSCLRYAIHCFRALCIYLHCSCPVSLFFSLQQYTCRKTLALSHLQQCTTAATGNMFACNLIWWGCLAVSRWHETAGNKEKQGEKDKAVFVRGWFSKCPSRGLCGRVAG